MLHFMIGWISDTRCQGCTNLQSPVKCLDHRGIVIHYAVEQGSVKLCDAWKFISEAIFPVVVSMVLHVSSVLASYRQLHVQHEDIVQVAQQHL